MHTSPDMVGLNTFDNLQLDDVALKNTADDEDDGHSSAQSWRKKNPGNESIPSSSLICSLCLTVTLNQIMQCTDI